MHQARRKTAMPLLWRGFDAMYLMTENLHNAGQFTANGRLIDACPFGHATLFNAIGVPAA